MLQYRYVSAEMDIIFMRCTLYELETGIINTQVVFGPWDFEIEPEASVCRNCCDSAGDADIEFNDAPLP